MDVGKGATNVDTADWRTEAVRVRRRAREVPPRGVQQLATRAQERGPLPFVAIVGPSLRRARGRGRCVELSRGAVRVVPAAGCGTWTPSRPPVWGAHVRQVPTSGPGRARSRSLRGRPSRHPCQRRGTPGSRPAVAVRVRPVLHAWEDVSDSKIDYNDAHIPPSRARRSRLVAVDIAAVAAFAGCGHTRSQAR